MNPITGLIHVMGEPDTGKTTFGLTSGYPIDQVAFIDDDIKGQTVVETLAASGRKFAVYHNLVKESVGMRETELYAHGMRIIEELERVRPSVIFWDTWTRFENTIQPAIAKNPGAYRESYSPMGTIKGAQIWQVSFEVEAQLIDRLLGCARLVILSTHLKEHSIGAAKTGAFVPDGKKPLIQKSALRVWLRHNPAGQAPIALILKRIGKLVVNEAGLPEMVSVLPRRINPGTWANIYGYWDNPVGNRELTAEEKPNEFELSILDMALTADQKDALRLNRIEAEKEDQAEKERKNELRIQARQLRQNGETPKAIADALGISVADVVTLTA